MDSSRALIPWAQERVCAFGREITAGRFTAASVTVPIRTLPGAAGSPAGGVVTHNHLFCRTIFSMAVSPAGMTVHQPVFPAAAVILWPAVRGFGRQLMAATPRSVQQTGM